MAAIYHLVPKKLTGNRLIPLNQLKTVIPDVYETEVSKYAGREMILQRQIPKINCLWNDVLHFSAVNPFLIFGRLKELGLGKFEDVRWFEIPIESISGLPAVVYRAPPAPRPNFSLNDEDVELLDIKTWTEPNSISAESEAYFHRCREQRKPIMAFQFIPHVLVCGEIDVSALSVRRLAERDEILV